MCAEGMGCERRWVRWVLRRTEIASGHPGVTWKNSPRMHWLSQPVVCSKMGQPELWRRIGDGSYSIAVGGTCRRSLINYCMRICDSLLNLRVLLLLVCKSFMIARSGILKMHSTAWQAFKLQNVTAFDASEAHLDQAYLDHVYVNHPSLFSARRRAP